jgi:hypothetical protein
MEFESMYEALRKPITYLIHESIQLRLPYKNEVKPQGEPQHSICLEEFKKDRPTPEDVSYENVLAQNFSWLQFSAVRWS